jgi:hypothetical protein
MTPTLAKYPWVRSQAEGGTIYIHPEDRDPWKAPWDPHGCVAAVRPSETSEADSRVILKAPEMYEILEEILNQDVEVPLTFATKIMEIRSFVRGKEWRPKP